jgi:hypothetical protein
VKRKQALLALSVAVLPCSNVLVADVPGARILTPGNYSARVTAIPCEACPPEIVRTLKAQPGIDGISVDPKASTVQFTVKPGAPIPLVDLQKALKAASDQMGMGADYQLKDVKSREQ